MKKINQPKSFKITTKDLIVDIWCGLDMSLINLCSNSNASKVYDDDNNDDHYHPSWIELSFACDHAGTNLDSQLIRHANDVMSRWPMNRYRITIFNDAIFKWTWFMSLQN